MTCTRGFKNLWSRPFGLTAFTVLHFLLHVFVFGFVVADDLGDLGIRFYLVTTPVATFVNLVVAVLLILKVVFKLNINRRLVRWTGAFNLGTWILFLSLFIVLLAFSRYKIENAWAAGFLGIFLVYELAYIICLLLIGETIAPNLEEHAAVPTALEDLHKYTELPISKVSVLQADSVTIIDSEELDSEGLGHCCDLRTVTIVAFVIFGVYSVVVPVAVLIAFLSSIKD